MIPKIKIMYSGIYDIALSRKSKIKYNPKRTIEGENVAKEFQSVWDKLEKPILTEMSRLTGLKWKSKEIECYFSFEAPYSFSNPLTIHFKKGWSFDYVTTYIIHELSHVLFWSNREKMIWPKNGIRIKKDIGVYKKYSKENYNTKLHIPVHALVFLVVNNVFGKDAEKHLRWERWWERESKSPMKNEYARSWEIAQKEGPKNIIKEVVLSRTNSDKK